MKQLSPWTAAFLRRFSILLAGNGREFAARARIPSRVA